MRLYGTLSSSLCWSLWLILHNVLLNAQNAGSADKRTRPWVHPRSSVFHRPIQYGRPNYIREYTREPGFEPYMQQGCCIQRLFDTLANHRTHNTCPHCHFDWRMGIGCAMAAERWVWTNEKPYFSYVEISALLTYWHGEFARKQISLWNDQQKTAASARAVKALIFVCVCLLLCNPMCVDNHNKLWALWATMGKARYKY